MDRWILSELNALVEQVDGLLESYDPTNAGRRIQEFIDQLSNWYVRRSRRRFWKSENDTDKLSAYISLYSCLETVAKLMAPLAPFVAEELYQGLVKKVNPDAPDSVHLAEFPLADTGLIEQPLMEATRLAMKVASMGRGARSKAGLRVRQPLAAVSVKVRSTGEADYLDLIRLQVLEELNIKELRALDDDSPLYRQAVEAAGEQPEATVAVGDHWVSLDGGYAVAVDSQLTPDLAEEGLAREVVHRIQNLRRDAKFELTDRIITLLPRPGRHFQCYERPICRLHSPGNPDRTADSGTAGRRRQNRDSETGRPGAYAGGEAGLTRTLLPEPRRSPSTLLGDQRLIPGQDGGKQPGCLLPGPPRGCV